MFYFEAVGSKEGGDDSDDIDEEEIVQAKKKKDKSEKKKHQHPHSRPKLPLGIVINTDENRYEIVSVLGAGGFGDVYKVRMLEPKFGNEFYALKTETNGPPGKTLNRLKMEMNILQECLTLPPRNQVHFAKMVDKGRTEAFKFIVMELVGQSIDRVQKATENRAFSFSSSIKLALQTLEGITDLHTLGYLHRDIKPQNFSIGLKEKADIIIILDFGIARRYVEKNSKAIRLPREMVRFLGTIRFASRNCHRSREQGRCDDLESWIFMVIDFTAYGSLPWSYIVDRETVCREKDKFFSGSFNKHISSLPDEIHKIIQYIDGLNYQSTPDYNYITMMLKRAALKRHAKLSDKFDWLCDDTAMLILNDLVADLIAQMSIQTELKSTVKPINQVLIIIRVNNFKSNAE